MNLRTEIYLLDSLDLHTQIFGIEDFCPGQQSSKAAQLGPGGAEVHNPDRVVGFNDRCMMTARELCQKGVKATRVARHHNGSRCASVELRQV